MTNGVRSPAFTSAACSSDATLPIAIRFVHRTTARVIESSPCRGYGRVPVRRLDASQAVNEEFEWRSRAGRYCLADQRPATELQRLRARAPRSLDGDALHA